MSGPSTEEVEALAAHCEDQVERGKRWEVHDGEAKTSRIAVLGTVCRDWLKLEQENRELRIALDCAVGSMEADRILGDQAPAEGESDG